MSQDTANLDPAVIDPIDIEPEPMSAEDIAEQEAFEAQFGQTSGQLAEAAAAKTPAPAAETPQDSSAAADAAADGSGEGSGEQGADGKAAAAASTAAPAARSDAAPGAAQPADDATPAVDPFAGMSPQAREILARVPQLEAELINTRRIASMVPALQSQIDKLSARAGLPSADGPRGTRDDQQPTGRAGRRRSLPSVDAIRAEVPEIAAALDDIAELTQRAGQAQHDPAQQPTANTPAAAGRDASRDEDEAVLQAVRPTWADDLISSDFQLWLATQPAPYRANVMGTSRASVMLEAFQKFDVARPRATQNTPPINSRMAAAVVAVSDGRPRPRRAAESEDPEEAAFVGRFNELALPVNRRA